ncbi:MAG: hypothetical protein QOK41_425 [Sphingomonadales bacterium]|jgi:hypothetical protein|nr:hypothetical protein [Sphingomonadales bacterium]
MTTRLLAFAAILAGCAAAPPATEQQGPPRELAGRSVGAPQRCVLINQSEALQIVDNDHHTLRYGSGKTIWANHLGACGFGLDDVLVTEPIGAYYCRGDLVRSFDRFSRIPGPACVLGDFVPYTRP